MKSFDVEKDIEELYTERDSLRNADDMTIYWAYLFKKIDEDLKTKGLTRIDYLAAVKRIFIDPTFRKRKKIANFRTVVRSRARIQNTYKKYVPDADTKEAREIKEEEYHKYR